MTDTEAYLKSLINWKSFNFILDRVTSLEDNSIDFRINISLGNFNDNLHVYEYTFDNGDMWFYDDEDNDTYYDIKKYANTGLLYRIYLFNSGSNLINNLISKLSGRFKIVYKDNKNLVFEEINS